MTTFGTFAPIATQSANNKVFAGRDNNQIGDVFMGIFAGVRLSKAGKEIYVFIDETDNVETLIFNCQSLQQGLVNAGANIGSRVAIQLASRFESSAKSRCGAGKTIVQYQVQCDPEFVADDEVKQAIAVIMGSSAPAAKPAAPAKPAGFGSFAKPAASAPAAQSKKPSPF
jgi:hypothetical protein